MDNQLIIQIEQQIEMLQANINVQQAQVTYLKSMIVILKQQAQTHEPTIGKFALDQPKDIKLPDQASQALDNWVKDSEKEQKKEPSNVKAPKEKKVKLIGGKRSYYRGLNKKMRYEPDLVRQFVDAYNSMQATGKYSKTEILDKIMKDFNLTCCVETLRKCIFFHDKYPGYEGVPTPPTDPALMPTITNPAVLDRVKSTKWLCR
ncbi:MAG: hypothetical protein J5614_09120, partial [Paludibacteraceae bacterium]|nr:hypothetical protein [Paludibacteraceae bacterium]